MSILFLMAITTVSTQKKKNAVDKFLDNICEKCNYCKIDPKCNGCEKCSQCTSRAQVIKCFVKLLLINKTLQFRVAADSARLVRMLMLARKDAGRAADSVKASRAAINDQNK